MRIILLSYLLFSTSTFLIGQKSQKEAWHEKGVDYFAKSEEVISNLDSCIYYTALAQQYFKKAESWDKYVECYSGLSTVYYWKGDFEQYKINFDKAFAAANEYLDKKNKSYGYVLINSSIYYSRRGDFKTSIGLFKEALSIIQQSDPMDPYIPYAYQNLGKAYWQKKDYLEALKYFQKSVSSRKIRGDSTSNYFVSDLIDIGKCYDILEQPDSALFLFKKSVRQLENLPKAKKVISEQVKIIGLRNIAKTYFKQNLPDSAFLYIQKVLELQKEDQAHLKSSSFELLARYYLAISKADLAIRNIDQSNFLFEKNNPTHPKHESLAVNYRLKAEAYYQLGQYDLSLANYQTALQKIAFSFASNNTEENPLPNDLISKSETLNILKGKAKVLMSLQEQSWVNLNFAQQAYACHQLSKSLIKALRIELLAQGSKYILAEKATPIYEQAIDHAVKLYEHTSEAKYLADAFNSAENNKAILLLESLTNDIAKKSTGIPDSLLTLEYDLTLDIAFLEKTINEEKLLNAKADQNKIEAWQNELFDLQNQYQDLIAQLEKDYQNYYETKYADGTIDIPALQRALDESTTLISYFVGEENTYAFQINKDFAGVKKLDLNFPLEESISQLRTVVSTAPKYDSASKDYANFTSSSKTLYKYLLLPLLSAEETNQKLIIIPDGILSYLPFELLISNDQISKKVDYSPSSLQYLINDFTISYDYSATLWNKNAQLNPASKLYTFAGFAPSFSPSTAQVDRSCSEQELYNLECSVQEVNAIQEIIGGETFIGTDATRNTFQENAAQYQILHLATHACIDPKNPMLHKIHLTDDYLSNYDLSTLELNTELAVLSACNTGSGQIQKGEGIMSLARTFTAAGCKSTILSLWPVNDCATSIIMTNLYDNFSKGQNKDEALRQAKFTYLKHAKKDETHPYYWAAFVQFGNSEALDLAGGAFSGWLFFGLGLGVLLVLVFSKFRR